MIFIGLENHILRDCGLLIPSFITYLNIFIPSDICVWPFVLCNLCPWPILLPCDSSISHWPYLTICNNLIILYFRNADFFLQTSRRLSCLNEKSIFFLHYLGSMFAPSSPHIGSRFFHVSTNIFMCSILFFTPNLIFYDEFFYCHLYILQYYQIMNTTSYTIFKHNYGNIFI